MLNPVTFLLPAVYCGHFHLMISGFGHPAHLPAAGAARRCDKAVEARKATTVVATAEQ